MKKNVGNTIMVSIIVLFVGCQTLDRHDYYDENNYIKIQINKDLEIYQYKADSNRRLIKTFWPNGELQGRTFSYKGKRDGKWMFYFDDGSISDEAFFVNDLPDSLHKSFYRNGRLSKLEKYKLGEKIGIWEYYDTSGNTVRTVKFEN